LILYLNSKDVKKEKKEYLLKNIKNKSCPEKCIIDTIVKDAYIHTEKLDLLKKKFLSKKSIIRKIRSEKYADRMYNLSKRFDCPEGIFLTAEQHLNEFMKYHCQELYEASETIEKNKNLKWPKKIILRLINMELKEGRCKDAIKFGPKVWSEKDKKKYYSRIFQASLGDVVHADTSDYYHSLEEYLTAIEINHSLSENTKKKILEGILEEKIKKGEYDEAYQFAKERMPKHVLLPTLEGLTEITSESHLWPNLGKYSYLHGFSAYCRYSSPEAVCEKFGYIINSIDEYYLNKEKQKKPAKKAIQK